MNYFALPSSIMPVLNLADRVATIGTRTVDRALATWAFLTQPQAIQTYRWLATMTVALAHLAWVCAVWAYVQVKRWVDTEVYLSQPLSPSAQVSDAIADMTDEELEAEFSNWGFSFEGYGENPDAVNPLIKSQPQAMTAPIATLRLAPSTSHEDGLDREYELADLTLAQLKPIATKLHLPTRKVRKSDLIDSILAAEGYEI